MQTVEQQRSAIRRRAFGNLLLILLDASRRSGGRFAVQPLAAEALRLSYCGVATLTGTTIAERDFEVLLACPPLWPFDRAAALMAYIVSPDDFRHPNSDGHYLCVDLAGVLPELLPGLLYDNLRLSHFRLDHCVDLDAAAFVRQHLSQFPADSRPLCLTAPELEDPRQEGK